MFSYLHDMRKLCRSELPTNTTSTHVEWPLVTARLYWPSTILQQQMTTTGINQHSRKVRNYGTVLHFQSPHPDIDLCSNSMCQICCGFAAQQIGACNLLCNKLHSKRANGVGQLLYKIIDSRIKTYKWSHAGLFSNFYTSFSYLYLSVTVLQTIMFLKRVFSQAMKHTCCNTNEWTNAYHSA